MDEDKQKELETRIACYIWFNRVGCSGELSKVEGDM